MRTYSCKSNKLRNVYTIGRGARNSCIKKWKINYFKIKLTLAPHVKTSFAANKYDMGFLLTLARYMLINHLQLTYKIRVSI